jgi:hypothetical protein
VTAAGTALKALTEGQPCRYCGLPSWLSDDTGPLHPCCQLWAAELQAGRPCPACAASRTYWRSRLRGR